MHLQDAFFLHVMQIFQFIFFRQMPDRSIEIHKPPQK